MDWRRSGDSVARYVAGTTLCDARTAVTQSRPQVAGTENPEPQRSEVARARVGQAAQSRHTAAAGSASSRSSGISDSQTRQNPYEPESMLLSAP